jgi:hypothetical protein
VKHITSTGTLHDTPWGDFFLVVLGAGPLFAFCMLFHFQGRTTGAVVLGGFSAFVILAGARMLLKGLRERTLRIEIDPEAQTVTFYNFVFTRDFWRNPPIPHVRCQFWNIRRADFNPMAGGSLDLRTTRGSVSVPCTMSGFGELREAFAAIAEEQEGLRMPSFWWLWFRPVAGIVGLALGVLASYLIWRAYGP